MPIAPEQPSSSEVSESACPNCERPDYAAHGWCRFCGYYGVLGKCVDLASWEQDYVNGEFIGEDQTEPEHEWIAAIKMVPNWAWCLLGILSVVSLVNVFVRLYTVPGGAYHILAAVALLVAGLLVTVGTHIYAGFLQMREDKQCSLFDVAFHPIQLWCAVVVQLPHSVKRVMFLWGGMWTVILVHLIVGVPYLQFIDFSAQPEPVAMLKPGDIASAVADASSGGKDMTLEDALGEFTDASQPEEEESERLTLKEAFGKLAEDLGNLPETLTAGPEPEIGFVTKTLETVIIGFRTDEETGAIKSLILAVNSDGAWRVAGTLSTNLDPELLEQLQARVASIGRERPFVDTELRANWVEPILRCQIEADYSAEEDRFERLTFLKML